MLNLRLLLVLVAVTLAVFAATLVGLRDRDLGAPGQRAQAARADHPFGPARSAQTGRVALVIGNGAYKANPLANPVNDAADIATALRSFGFRVIARTDLNTQGMRDAIREFAKELRSANVGLFYYAGHGVQIKGENYLVPINEDIQSEAEAEDRTIRMGYVLGELEGAQVKVSIVILDACRDNPFARGYRSAARGLAQMDAASGSLIAFATSPGSVAADGADRNGIYTKHLLASLRQGDTDILKVFNRATEDVYTETGGKQRPWFSTSLIGDFYFNPTTVAAERPSVPPPPAAAGDQPSPPPPVAAATPPAPVTAATPSAAPPAPVADADASERLFWESVKDSRKKAELQAYLQAYPNGRFASLARARLAEIEQAASRPRPAAPPPAPAPRPAPASTAEQSYQAAEEAMRGRDVVGAVALYRQAAEQGHVRAQLSLGNIHSKGSSSVPRDDAEAARWYRKAAEQGDAQGQASLGQMYSTGLGVPRHEKEAAKWYRKAAEQGHVGAQYGLGIMYVKSARVAQDFAEGVSWLRRAAERGHVRAQSVLGDIYSKGGLGVPRDDAEAVRWYRMAAAQGDADARQSLARLGAR